MKTNPFFNTLVFLFLIITPLPASARCVVCYTNGMSGASIAVLVIISFFFVVFVANWTLKKILNKY